MLTNNVSLDKFPLIPRRGWSKRLISAPVSEFRTYNDEPLIISNGQLILTEYSINSLVTPAEAAALAKLDSKLKGDPCLFQDPLDFYATLNRLVGPKGDFTQGILQRTGNQLCPVKLRGLTGRGEKQFYRKPIYYVEDLSTDGTTVIPFDAITRGGNEAANLAEFRDLADFVPAQFTYWNPFRITGLDIGDRKIGERTLGISPDCEEESVQVSVSLQETYDWLVDDAFVIVTLPAPTGWGFTDPGDGSGVICTQFDGGPFSDQATCETALAQSEIIGGQCCDKGYYLSGGRVLLTRVGFPTITYDEAWFNVVEFESQTPDFVGRVIDTGHEVGDIVNLSQVFTTSIVLEDCNGLPVPVLPARGAFNASANGPYMLVSQTFEFKRKDGTSLADDIAECG